MHPQTQNPHPPEVSAATFKKNGLVQEFPILAIRTAPENDLLYESFGLNNDDDMALALSIQEFGVQEPLVLSADGVLLSGHRRFGAAKRLGLRTVPVRFTDTNFDSLTNEERLKVLRTFNQQREKTAAEKLREVLLEIDSDEAYETLKRQRAQRQEITVEINVSMGASKKRPRITTTQYMDAAKKVIDGQRKYWPLSVRRIHYLLLNDPPLKHDKKPDSRYQNDASSYKSLTDLLLRARLNGAIPMQSIEDSTRPVRVNAGWDGFQHFLQSEAEDFLMGYQRNMQQGQPHHLEIMLEKNALRSVIDEVASQYSVPLTVGRGYSSLSPRHALVKRFKDSGKAKLVLLMLTDHDPDGEMIAESFARSLRDDFGVLTIEPVKVLLTAEDVQRYDLPSDLDAKRSSPHYRKFFAKYGGKAVELDAVPTNLIQEKLRQAIESVMDFSILNQQIEAEKEDAAALMAYRNIVVKTMAEVNL